MALNDIEPQLSLVPESGTGESITRRVYLSLRRDIMCAKLAPGLRLKIEELRSIYGVGSSPLREALSLLTSDSLVERIDQKGFRVCQVSELEYSELLRTRCWLEDKALRESMANRSAKWEEQLVLANHRLSQLSRSIEQSDSDTHSDWEVLHKIFHETLLSECASSILIKFCSQLYDQNVRYRQLSARTAYPDRDVNNEHTMICDAVLARDVDLAVSLLLSHYMCTGEFVASELKS